MQHVNNATLTSTRVKTIGFKQTIEIKLIFKLSCWFFVTCSLLVCSTWLSIYLYVEGTVKSITVSSGLDVLLKLKQCNFNFNEGRNRRFQTNDKKKISFQAIMLIFCHMLTPSLFYVVSNLFVCETKTVKSITVSFDVCWSLGSQTVFTTYLWTSCHRSVSA